MTATLLGISIEGREARKTADGIEYKYVALVSTDDKNDGPEQVSTAAGLPTIGDLYQVGNDFNSNAVVTDKDVRQKNAPDKWEVVITANTNVQSDPLQAIENPLLKPPEISFGFTTRQVLVANYFDDPANPPVDRNFSKGFRQPNGEPVVPAPQAEVDDPFTTIVRNYGSLDPEVLRAANNSVNLTIFHGSNPRTLRLRASARSAWHKSVGNYWIVQFNLTYRWETWDIQYPMRGTYFWDGGYLVGTRKSINIEGRPVLVDLTTDGDHNTTADLNFERIRYYREIDFNTLGII